MGVLEVISISCHYVVNIVIGQNSDPIHSINAENAFLHIFTHITNVCSYLCPSYHTIAVHYTLHSTSLMNHTLSKPFS